MPQEKRAQTLGGCPVSPAMTSEPDKDRILTALQKGTFELQGQFVNSSNYTFLGMLTYEDLKFEVVYKPTRGQRPLWDFPDRTLTKREVAAFIVSEALGWELVPPTVYRRQKTPLGSGSLQYYIHHNPEYHYFNFSLQHRQRLRPVVLFDLLVNNADRKGGHVLVDNNDHLWLIDHGVCFHVEHKLRTVIWDFAGEAIPPHLLDDLKRFEQTLEEKKQGYESLKPLLSPAEIKALQRRSRMLRTLGTFPHPDSGRRSYPWPPV